MENAKAKILIIDDESYIRESVRNFFEDRGYYVAEAYNGSNGLEVFEKIKPDIVLCDLRMPGMDGLEVLGAITDRSPVTPVIIVSGAGNISDTVEALRLGAWDYIFKPIEDMTVLAHAVTKELERAAFIKEKELYRKNLERANSELKESLETIKRTRDQLVQAEKMAALGELVAGIAHEINTPVGIGITGASFLQSKTLEISRLHNKGKLKKSEFEAYLDIVAKLSSSILMNMERAGDLITSFKQIAVDQTTEDKRVFNLREYIEDILLSLRPGYKKNNHSIKLICPNDISIYSYPGVLSQIITNLVINSFEHGFISVEKGKININIIRGKNTITLLYRDNGVGITEGMTAKIFDPFYTTARGRGGTGLGMSIVFNLVTQTLKGTISCKSDPGKGIVFNIKIPYVRPDEKNMKK